jgi:P27 family predicted phage terminase small subunit
LAGLGLLTEADGAAFAGYCVAHSELVRLNKAFKDCGYQVIAEKHTVDGAGNEHIEIKNSPILVQRTKTLQVIRMYCQEFGMTPSARGKMSVPGAEGSDPQEDFLNDRR